ncbi:hypothetical protein BGZ82_006149, partial [Podila clonocystis]
MEHTSSHEHSGQHSEHLKPEVDQFFRQEGLSEEHWQRIYDLRYCSILVPLVDDTGKKKHARQDSPSPKRKASPPQDAPHLPTPTTTPRAVSRPFTSSTGGPAVTPPPPIRYLPKDPQGGQEEEEEEEEARPLKKRMLDADHEQDDVMETDGDDDQGNMSEDSFHDALDTSDEPVSLQRPRPIEPAHVTHFNRIPMARDRTPSVSSRSSRSSWVSVDAKWTDQNWQDLEALYVAMEGDMLAEKELGTIAERFLAEYGSRTGEFQGATSSYRSYNRSSANPYPVHRLRRNWTPQRSVSPAPSQSSVASSSSSFVRRAHNYNRMDEDHLPGYQIKSVFKRKLAAGLKTVGELIPFWREVEDGKTDIKEE